MMTELGKVTHRYWYEAGTYYRQPLQGGNVEQWAGRAWSLTLRAVA